MDQWKIKRTQGRSKSGKQNLVRSLHENPNKSGTQQDHLSPNKQTQTVYLIASKPLFYIKEAENKKATGGEVSGLRTEAGKAFSM